METRWDRPPAVDQRNLSQSASVETVRQGPSRQGRTTFNRIEEILNGITRRIKEISPRDAATDSIVSDPGSAWLGTMCRQSTIQRIVAPPRIHPGSEPVGPPGDEHGCHHRVEEIRSISKPRDYSTVVRRQTGHRDETSILYQIDVVGKMLFQYLSTSIATLAPSGRPGLLDVIDIVEHIRQESVHLPIGEMEKECGGHSVECTHGIPIVSGIGRHIGTENLHRTTMGECTEPAPIKGDRSQRGDRRRNRGGGRDSFKAL